LFAPLNEYFEVVPNASIINKLTKDLNAVDSTMFVEGYIFLICTSLLISLVYLFFLEKVYVLVIVSILYIFIFFLVQKFSLDAGTELNRLENENKSPAISCLN